MPYPWSINDPDAPTHRMVDGVEVPLTDAEKQAIVDEWNAEEKARRDNEWRESRRREYAEKLSVEAQLEAIMENHLGDPTKLDALAATYQDIKARNPKPVA